MSISIRMKDDDWHFRVSGEVWKSTTKKEFNELVDFVVTRMGWPVTVIRNEEKPSDERILVICNGESKCVDGVDTVMELTELFVNMKHKYGRLTNQERIYARKH